MRFFNFILLFAFFPAFSFSQQDTSQFFISVGKFKCKPNYVRQDVDTNSRIKPTSNTFLEFDEKTKTYKEVKEKGNVWFSVLSTLIPTGQNTEGKIYFPERLDSSLYILPDGSKLFKVKKNNYRSYLNIHDSIYYSDVNHILKSELKILNKNKTQRIKEFSFQILFKDGSTYSATFKNAKIHLNKKTISKISDGNNVLYIGVFGIEIYNKEYPLHISGEGFGWKVKK
ncbi:MAG: hypothetical protein K0S32_3152 [Bacteroidetes bacterium]|jgi:hypothetical protein|nr:hypothetical protein [Bacteroidota bacterium]